MLDHDAVDRLLQFLAHHVPHRAARAAELWEAAAASLSVRVAGRSWSGKSTIASLLESDELSITEDIADCMLYVLPGSLRDEDRAAITALRDPIVVLNKADAISPDPSRIAKVTEAISTELGVPVLPLTAHVAAIEPDDQQFEFLRSLAASSDAGAQVASIVFSEAPVRRWGPPAVAVAVSALRLDPALDQAGIAKILTAFSGIDRLRVVLQERSMAMSAQRCTTFVESLEACAGEVPVRDAVEQFLAGPVGGELSLRAASWSGQSVSEMRKRSREGSASQRRAAIRAERALVRRLQPA